MTQHVRSNETKPGALAGVPERRFAQRQLHTIGNRRSNSAAAHDRPPSLDSDLGLDFLPSPARGPIDLLCTKTGRFFDKPLGQTTLRDGKSAWASDHYGLSVTFELDGRAAI
jgi:hypothetical protein